MKIILQYIFLIVRLLLFDNWENLQILNCCDWFSENESLACCDEISDLKRLLYTLRARFDSSKRCRF